MRTLDVAARGADRANAGGSLRAGRACTQVAPGVLIDDPVQETERGCECAADRDEAPGDTRTGFPGRVVRQESSDDGDREACPDDPGQAAWNRFVADRSRFGRFAP